MLKKRGLSRLIINILIASLIIIIGIIIFVVFRNIMHNQNGQIVLENLDLKISQVQKIDDSTLNVTVKRNQGEGEFFALSFVVDDGTRIEIIKKIASIEENQEQTFSLTFLLINASKVKRISITPIFKTKRGEEVIGNLEDEYITPNVCSNYCPTGAQCGVNDCGVKCGSGCNSGYLCLNYKCIKESTEGSGGGSSTVEEEKEPVTCTHDCSGKECGDDGCGISCGTCTLPQTCNSTNLCSCTPTTCVALGRTCGTVSNECGGTLNCGTCSTGYTCAVNGTCIKNVVITCNGVTCNSEEYCSNGVCLLNVTGKTYFVSTTGSDSNPGTFSLPWKTWQKAVQVSQPGDITYIRGGVWQPTSHVTVNGWESWAVGMYIDPKNLHIGVSGTANAPIRYYNYPGEKPILDGSLVALDSGFNGGIDIESTQYLSFKGLTIKNIYQRPSGSEAFGIGSFDSANLKFENMIVHDIDGRGFQHWGGAWTQWGNEADNEAYYPSNFQSDNTSWINCDAYNLYDRYAEQPGNAADGFIAHGHYGNYFTFEGCRAWNYSDDGFNTFFEAYTLIKNCWAMSTDKYDGLSSWDIEANGFKLNGVNYLRVPNYQLFGENFVKVENSIAANCIGRGFINNIDTYEDDPNNKPSNGLFYNNLGYKDNTGLYDGGENFEGKNSYNCL